MIGENTGMVKDVRKIKTERDLQNAFLKLLTTKGFRHLTVADICQASMTSRSTFYAHYLDKYDLLEQMVAHYTAMFAQRVSGRFQQIIAGQIDEMVHGLVQDMAENQATVRILFTVHEPEADLKANFYQLLYREWENFISSQSVPRKAPLELIASMGTNVQMTLIEWVINHDGTDLNGVVEAVNTIRKAVLIQIKLPDDQGQFN